MAEQILKVNSYLSPKVLQITGIALLLVFATFWIISGRQSALLCSSSLTLIGVGSYAKAVDGIKGVVANGTLTGHESADDRAPEEV